MLHSKSPPDRSKIEMGHADEVKYWSKHFGVTPDELEGVIEKVGNAATAVRKQLQFANMPSKPNA
jgi:hypothetical protein